MSKLRAKVASSRRLQSRRPVTVRLQSAAFRRENRKSAGRQAEHSADCKLKQSCKLCFAQSGLLWHLSSFHTAQTDRRRAPGFVYGASLGIITFHATAVRISCASIQVMQQLPTNHHFRVLQFPLNFAEASVARSALASSCRGGHGFALSWYTRFQMCLCCPAALPLLGISASRRLFEARGSVKKYLVCIRMQFAFGHLLVNQSRSGQHEHKKQTWLRSLLRCRFV